MAITGYRDIAEYLQLVDQLTRLGLQLSYPKHGGGERNISIIPLPNGVPIYSRDAAIFTGTFEEIRGWVAGVDWRDAYLRNLKLVNSNKIEIAEQSFRNQQLIQTIKEA